MLNSLLLALIPREQWCLFQYVTQELKEQSKHTIARTRDQAALSSLIVIGGNQFWVRPNEECIVKQIASNAS
jgi:hypothetical protein